MNQYYNYKKWRLARIAKAPLNDPATSLRTEVGNNYYASIGDNPKYMGTKGDYRLYSPSMLEGRENKPDITLTIPVGTHNITHNLMHHALDTHDNVLPDYSPHEEGGRSRILHIDDLQDKYSVEDQGRRDIFPNIKIGGPIDSAEDIPHKISQAFAGVLLHYLNTNMRNFNHPGIDALIDKPDLSDNPHIDITTNHLQGPKGQRFHVHHKLAEYHREQFRKYLEHHLANPRSTQTYNEFLDTDTENSSPEDAVIKDLLKDILSGQHHNENL